MKFPIRIFAVLVTLVAAMVVAIPSANAGALCDNTGICGDVFNHKNSTCRLLVSNNWNPDLKALAGDRQLVDPGKWATFRDVDGYDSLTGCEHRALVPTGWGGYEWGPWTRQAKKVVDTENVVVQTRKR